MTDHEAKLSMRGWIDMRTVCATCDRPVRFVHDDEKRILGYWAHVDPDELAASMARHPAGRKGTQDGRGATNGGGLA